MKTALLLIETQGEWLTEEGRLRGLLQDKAAFDEAGRACLRLLGAARENNIEVVHCHLDFTRGYALLGQAKQGLRHAMQHFQVWSDQRSEPAPGFAPKTGEFMVAGRGGSSAFAGSNLDTYLRNNGIGRLVIAGFAAHVCILATATQGHDLGYEVVLPTEAIGAFSTQQKSFVSEQIYPHFASQTTLLELTEEWRRHGALSRATRRFAQAVGSADLDTLKTLLSEDLRVEGWLGDQWACWDLAQYLGRVTLLSGQLKDAQSQHTIEKIELTGVIGFVDTTFRWEEGGFDDRLLWCETTDGWKLKHKTFRAIPPTQ